MPTDDRIKVSVEYPGLWLGMETSLAPGEDPVAAFIHAKATVDKAFREMNPGAVMQVNPQVNIRQSVFDSKEEEDINTQFEITKQKVVDANTKDEAEQYMRESGFSLNVELKQIANSKKQNGIIQ